MIAEILPQAVVAVESFGGLPPLGELPRAEGSAIATAGTQRRAEFTAGRECARAALAKLGAPAGPVPPGRAGEPRWPAGIVGSITHCAGYRACAVARAQTTAAIGIDAEPARALPAGLLNAVAGDAERTHVADLNAACPGVPWDLALFCAKEAVYKAWFPLTGHRPDFADVRVEFTGAGRFTALLAGACEPRGGPPARIEGRWLVRNGLVLTAASA